MIKVVVADDDQDLRQLLCLSLSQFSDMDIVGEAADGRTALELCRKFEPNAVFLDIEMPVLTGLEAAVEIRNWTPRPTSFSSLRAKSMRSRLSHLKPQTTSLNPSSHRDSRPVSNG